jgi:hypothetical protein
VEASWVEGEIVSEPGAPSHIQKAHPPQQIIDNLNERVTRYSRSAHLSYFSNTLFVALFEPRDVGHAISDLSWVNSMHEELENFERNQVLLRWILLAFLMLILRVVGLTERALLALIIFLDLLSFAGLLRNSLQLHSPPPMPSV